MFTETELKIREAYREAVEKNHNTVQLRDKDNIPWLLQILLQI